jgi:hypothetical protein
VLDNTNAVTLETSEDDEELELAVLGALEYVELGDSSSQEDVDEMYSELVLLEILEEIVLGTPENVVLDNAEEVELRDTPEVEDENSDDAVRDCLEKCCLTLPVWNS